MISALTVKNFNGVDHQKFAFKRVSAVVDGIDVDAFLVFDSLWLLDRLARGMVAASAPYGWIGESNPTFLKVEMSNSQVGEIFYEVVLQRFGLTTSILSEKLYSENAVFLVRTRKTCSLGDNAQHFDIDSSQAALSVAMPFGGLDPITAAKGELTQLVLAIPNPVQMDSAIKYGLLDRDVVFRYLASHIVGQQQTHPIIYGVMMVSLKELGSDVTGFSVETNSFNATYLAVRYANRYKNRAVPFELIGQNEKMLIFAAFIRAVNEYVSPITVVWHSPLNWLGQKESGSVIKMLAKSFAAQGQLIMLSREYEMLRGVK